MFCSDQTLQKSSGSTKFHSKFTLEDDELLKKLVARYGENNWIRVANGMQNRNERQCRERWVYYLSPKINTSPWTEEEDQLLISKVHEMGNKWVKISAYFPFRTDAMIKNRYNLLKRHEAKMKKKSSKSSKKTSSKVIYNDNISSEFNAPQILVDPIYDPMDLFDFERTIMPTLNSKEDNSEYLQLFAFPF